MMKPHLIEPGTRYPLLLFLHGAPSRGGDNSRHLESLPTQMSLPEWHEKYPCFLLAPQCSSELTWVDMFDELEAMIESVVETYPIDRRRIYLTGFSMGGVGSWGLAIERPDLFAAVVPICGIGTSENSESLVDVPLWVVHGDADKVVVVDRVHKGIEVVRRLEGNLRYTELKGAGHRIWLQTYQKPDGVIPWMFEQINTRTPIERSRMPQRLSHGRESSDPR